MRGTIAKRLRREAEIEATTRHRDAISKWGLRSVVGVITRAKKRLLKRVVRFNIESPNRQTMMSRTEARTRTKKIVWSFIAGRYNLKTRRYMRAYGGGGGSASKTTGVMGTKVARHVTRGSHRARVLIKS